MASKKSPKRSARKASGTGGGKAGWAPDSKAKDAPAKAGKAKAPPPTRSSLSKSPRPVRRAGQPSRNFVDADTAQWRATITAFIGRHVEAAKAEGVVVGVSGGLDSAVVTALAVEALGKKRVLPIMLPAPTSNPLDARHARLSCSKLGLKPVLHEIGPILGGLWTSLGYEPEARIRGNAKSRARMLLLYAEAQKRNYLVCGTGNKSELLTGYFTKWGDGGVDFLPIGDLYKTQVRELARLLGVPKPIIDKPPSAGLYPGQTDEGDMGLSYEDLDAVLRGLELNHSLETISRKTGLAMDLVKKVDSMVRKTEHKRRMPLIPKIGARTVGLDWRRPVHWDA